VPTVGEPGDLGDVEMLKHQHRRRV